MFIKLAEKLHVLPSDQTAFRHEIGTRMVAVDLDGRGSLFVHSAVKAGLPALKTLGSPAHFAIPNKWRRGPVAEIKAAYPDAKFYGAPDLEKLEKLVEVEAIRPGATYPWSGALDHLVLEGIPFFNEVAFFHRESRTLLLADVAGYLYDGGPLTAQLAMKLLKAGAHPGWSASEKKLYVRDRKTFEASLAKMLQWDFKRVLVAHGPRLENDARAQLTEILMPAAADAAAGTEPVP
ncbi:MAG TPA: hypothetical protein VFV50_17910 [Bdellovibrionales bacterium]|nr:hypothetical protein [Bdellovibrionales bacterium]